MDENDTQVKLLEGKLKLYSYPYPFQSKVRNAILYCHGGIEGDDLPSLTKRALPNKSSPRFKVPPWTFLCFYAPHESILFASDSDPRLLRTFMTYPNSPFEIITPEASSYDYTLASWKPDKFSEKDQQIRDALSLARLSVTEGTPAVFFDIITLDSWSFKKTVTLQEALNILARTGHLYNKIHCLFCRYVFGRHMADCQRYSPIRPANRDVAPMP